METPDTPNIGNRSDALRLLDALIDKINRDTAEITEALEALRDALEREII